MWSSDRPVRNAVALARRLASAFSRTGLWPVLWLDQDDPSNYMDGALGVDGIAHVNVARFLASRWAALRRTGPPFVGGFPGLASGPARRRAENPFSTFARYRSQIGRVDSGAYSLLLIPCRRPADAISVVGFELSGPTDGSWSALLRSWEDRFGAYLVMLTPAGRTVFAVNSPPHDDSDARQLAAEILASTPPQGPAPNALAELTLRLIRPRAGYLPFDSPMSVTGGTWAFGLGGD